jgi:hypothetical protein
VSGLNQRPYIAAVLVVYTSLLLVVTVVLGYVDLENDIQWQDSCWSCLFVGGCETPEVLSAFAFPGFLFLHGISFWDPRSWRVSSCPLLEACCIFLGLSVFASFRFSGLCFFLKPLEKSSQAGKRFAYCNGCYEMFVALARLALSI